MKLLGDIARGIDPVARKQEARLKNLTLGEAFTDYLAARKDLKPKTLYDYQRVMDLAFTDWRGRPLTWVTADRVEKKHACLGGDHGEAYANLSMRVLKAIFNFAMGKYRDAGGTPILLYNPVKALSERRAWYKVERRQTLIKNHELGAWYQGVMSLTNTTARDYLLLLLFTGLRRNEAAKLEWCDVDLKGRTLLVRDTKNGNDHRLPLSDYLLALLEARKGEVAFNPAGYVFPANSREGHIVDARKQMGKVGVAFTVHDLRRTFITIAESLDISAYALKRLVNHSLSGDVTAGYIVTDVERLRAPMSQITDYILKCAGVMASAEIVPMGKSA